MKPFAHSLKALSLMLSYPDADCRSQLQAAMDVLQQEATLSRARMSQLQAFVSHTMQLDPLDAQAHYVETFDRGRSTCLNLFEHVHGDSRERGPAMVDLARTYAQFGLLLDPDELPDHLCVVLEFASTQAPEIAKEFLAEMAHILSAIFSGLQKRTSPYATLLAAVLELSGHRAEAVSVPAEASIDESWQEPEAFSGCSNQGQAKQDQAQVIHFVD